VAARRFTQVSNPQAAASLARRFVPLADSLRDLLTRFGLRSYRVLAVRIAWSGGRRGYGTPTVVSEELLLPTPKIAPTLDQVIQPIGALEVGSVEMSQISGRYSEEQLLGLEEDGSPLPPNVEFFYEVEFFPHAGPSVRRRFAPKGTPTYYPGRLQWTLRLERSFDSRERNGDVEGP
jgi:hypothetical protein